MSIPTLLERRFFDLNEEALRDTEFSWAPEGYGSLTWKDLLASPRVLLVSEAGTGKTYECQSQQQRLWNAGMPAFWIELAGLSRAELPSALGGDARARFDLWLNEPTSVATFFLDSVDELMLTKASFEYALNTVSRGIGARYDRAHFVVTSRPTDFDRHALLRILPFPDREEVDVLTTLPPGHAFAEAAISPRSVVRRSDAPAPAPVIRTVGLMPLTLDEVRQFATSKGVADPTAFTDALVEKNALSFARRPQDLIELANAWNMDGRLRTHREQVSMNVAVKLRGAQRRNERQLPHAKSLEGAKTLALAMLLARRLALRHGIDSDSEQGFESVLDPRDILQTWTDTEVKALLERSLFGHAGYGRVRFHHRSIVEFLAAEQLADLIIHGTPWRNIASLLFTTTPQGIEVLRPTMRPSAVWLASRSRDVFEGILRREPEALLQYGDPEALDERDRLRALMAYVDRVRTHQREGVDFEPAQVQRLACAEVLNALPDLWESGITNPDVRRLFLQLFTVWPTEAGNRISFEVLTNATGDHVERVWAAEVLAAADDARIPNLVEQLVVNAATWPDEVASSVALRLLPHHISADQLCVLLDRLPTGRNSPARDLARSLTYQVTGEAFSAMFLERLRDGLVASIVQGMHWNRVHYRYSTTRPELAEPLAAVCARQLTEQPLRAPLLVACIVATQLTDHEFSEHTGLSQLRQSAARWPACLRRVAFIASHTLLEGIHPAASPLDKLTASHESGLVRLSPELDGAWVLASLADQEQSVTLRATLLDAALQGIAPPSRSPAARMRALASAVSDLPELCTRVEQIAARRDDRSLRLMRADSARSRAAREKREAKRREDWLKFAVEVVTAPERFFTPERSFSTVWNIWLVMRQAGDADRESGWDRSFLETRLSAEVANRLKKALRDVWRKDKPTLPHERSAADRNTTLVRWSMCNTALVAESEDPGWADRLSAEEATLAARYIPIEPNRFPQWLSDLASAHPGPVRAILIELLDDELQHVHESNSRPMTLQHLEYAAPVVRTLLMPHLEAWLLAQASELAIRSAPVNPTYGMERLIRLVLKHGSNSGRAALSRLSLQALGRPAEGGWELMWFSAAFFLDPMAGTRMLEQRLAEYPVGSLGEGARLLGGLFGDQHEAMRVSAHNEQFTPDLLLRLTRLAYTHVRRSDDVEHIGSFTPDARDGAEHSRGALLTALLETDAPGAWEAKMALAADPLIGTFADRARALTLAHAAREAEGDPLTLAQVQAVLLGVAAPPMTRDQMFTLLNHRLDDLEELLLSDTSPRETWARVTVEREMRRNIGHQLEGLAAGAYTVNQEAVSADEKETDIRLLSSASSETGVIELKVGENASGAELRDAIRDQLVRKYLAPKDRRAGCLLVTVGSDRGWEHPDTGIRLNINGLRQLLSNEASRVELQLQGQVRVAARVLDLRPRLDIERKRGTGSTNE